MNYCFLVSKILHLLYNNDVHYLYDFIFFQPPADVHCKGFRTKQTPPKMPNYFSYSSELISYAPVKKALVPMISQRKVR